MKRKYNYLDVCKMVDELNELAGVKYKNRDYNKK
jgi:hypothetical protein